MVHVSDELKEVIIKEHIEKGRTYRSLSAEYGYSTGVISDWVRKSAKNARRTSTRMKTSD